MPEKKDKEIKASFLIICLFLIVGIFIVYGQVKDHEFLNYDDNVYVTENRQVQSGFSRESLVWSFTSNHTGNWHPLTWLSHMSDYQIFGSNPKGHHINNLILHTANVLLLFLLFKKMTGALWRSALVAALFGFHPLNIDSVAWVAERKNLLSTFFGFLTIWAYVLYVSRPEIKRFLGVAVFLVFSLMSKPMLVTLPFVLLLLDYWPLNRLQLEPENKKGKKNKPIKSKGNQFPLSHLIKEKVPLLVIVIASSVVTFLAQKTAGAVRSDAFPLSVRINNALVSYLEYLWKTFWPTKLSILYPHPGSALPVWKGTLCGAVLLGVTLFVITKVRKLPFLTVGWFWYLGTLVPVIGVVQVGVQAMAGRYMYVPLIGIFFMVAWGGPLIFKSIHFNPSMVQGLGGTVIALLMFHTWNQVSFWKNSVTVFQHSIQVVDEKYPSFSNIYNNLGMALKKKGKFNEAVNQFRSALKLNPEHYVARNNLGIILIEMNRFKEAVLHFEITLKKFPNNAELQNYLGVALAQTGQFDKAVVHFKKSVSIYPDSAETQNHLGMALSEQNKLGEAIHHYKKAIEINPQYAEAHNNLGTSLGRMMKLEEAVSHYKEALRLHPGHPSAQKNLGIILSMIQK